LRVLLDQNVPEEIARWPRGMRPSWSVHHAKEAGLAGCPDAEVFRWAQAKAAMVVTFDEDFADARSFPLGSHHGVVRLRVWPTTVEQTVEALTRLLTQVPEDHLPGSLIIIDRGRIRVRRRP
jgi:predicted nuclease of predicted toxin-antitoxin system